VKRTTL